MRTGVWELLFKLLVLRCLMDVNGKMWRRSPCHLYVVEILQEKSALPRRPARLVREPPGGGKAILGAHFFLRVMLVQTQQLIGFS